MSSETKETVVVIHGTWAAPTDGEIKWWQPPGPETGAHFTRKLDAALDKRGCKARCWAHCSAELKAFDWTGENDWVDRTNASAAILEYFNALDQEGYRYHVVAHSHGGTAVVDALYAIDPANTRLGRVVTIGTPFFDTQGPIRQRKLRVEKLVSLVSIIVTAIGAVLLLSNVYHFAREAGFLNSVSGMLGFIALVLFVALGLGRILRQIREMQAPSSNNSSSKPHAGLSISSRNDEVLQILTHLSKMPNLLAVKPTLLPYLAGNFRQLVDQKTQIARIQGAMTFRDLTWFQRRLLLLLYSVIVFIPAFAFLMTQSQPLDGNRAGYFFKIAALIFLGNLFYVFIISAYAGPRFYSAFLTPFRWLGHVLTTVAAVPSNIITYVVRSRAWKELQTYALGLHGYGFNLPTVGTKPKTGPHWNFVYEELSDEATNRALKRREAWLNKRVGDVTRALSALTATAADLEVLLKDVAQDLTLVHAAYYTDDECIERIADWISGSDIISADNTLDASLERLNNAG